MNLSAKHGGGLTLMRVLGNDLGGFEKLIRPIDYPVKGFETEEVFKDNEMNLWQIPGDFQQRPMPSRFSTDYLFFQFKRILNIPNPAYINWDYYRKYYTAYLQKHLDLRFCKFLIVPQNAHSVIIANHLHRKFSIAYVTWIMDDNLLRFDTGAKKYFYDYPKGYEKEFGYHLKNARHIFTISDNMGEFYKSRFGISYSVLFSPTEPADKYLAVDRTVNNPFRFCHFGRVWKWTADATERFAAQLEFLNATLDIYSYVPLEGPLKNNKRVTIRTPVSSENVLEIMKQYDGVTIFYGFNDDVRHWSEMNISTKMSECLASGLPVIFVGPKYGAMTKWAHAYDCGIVIDDPDMMEQWNQISKLRDPVFRSNLIRRSLAVAKEYTSIQAMRTVWQHGWNKI